MRRSGCCAREVIAVIDEVELLRRVAASVERAPAEIEGKVRGDLLMLISSGSAVPQAGRWSSFRTRIGRVTVVAAAALVATALALLALAGRGATPSIIDKAYAAVTASSGVMHFVVQHQSAGSRSYEEYWIDLADPTRQRIVQSTNGAVTRQIVYVGGTSPSFAQTGRDHDPLTVIMQAPPVPPSATLLDPSANGIAPLDAYRRLLASGHPVEETQIAYQGEPAYKVKVTAPDMQATFILDGQTYFPIETRIEGHSVLGDVSTVDRFLMFDILPASAENLLEPVSEPVPFSARAGNSHESRVPPWKGVGGG
jgi:hypothetical protein